MSVLRTQKYGPVGGEDPTFSESDDNFSPPPPLPPSSSARRPSRPSTSPFLSSLSTPHGLQEALDEHPPPPELHTPTVWLIRAFPILATASWSGTLVMLLLLWLFSDHKQHYLPSLGAMPYLSDIGAHHKTLFFIGNTCTAVFYIVSLFQERLLRAKRVMVEATREKCLWVSIGVLDTFLGLVAGICLVLLAIFDSQEWWMEHQVFFITFVICITQSGLLQTLEVEHLWHEHPDRHDLRDGTILKWTFLAFSSACGIAFAILDATCDGNATTEPYEECYRVITAAALLQWSSALGLSLYFSTLILDVWPLHRHSPPTPVVWADRTGVRGVWVVHPETREKLPVEIGEGTGVGLLRAPVSRGEMIGEEGERKRCAHVLVPHPVVEGRMVPLSASAHPSSRSKKRLGEAEKSWFSEGKRSGR